MPAYAARIECVDGEYLVCFADVPEALTAGATYGEAVALAGDALAVALAGYVRAGRPLPPHRAAEAGEVMVVAGPV